MRTHDMQAAGVLGPGPHAAGGDRFPESAGLRARAADAEPTKRVTDVACSSEVTHVSAMRQSQSIDKALVVPAGKPVPVSHYVMPQPHVTDKALEVSIEKQVHVSHCALLQSHVTDKALDVSMQK